jgi:hypothetical protein
MELAPRVNSRVIKDEYDVEAILVARPGKSRSIKAGSVVNILQWVRPEMLDLRLRAKDLTCGVVRRSGSRKV